MSCINPTLVSELPIFWLGEATPYTGLKFQPSSKSQNNPACVLSYIEPGTGLGITQFGLFSAQYFLLLCYCVVAI